MKMRKNTGLRRQCHVKVMVQMFFVWVGMVKRLFYILPRWTGEEEEGGSHGHWVKPGVFEGTSSRSISFSLQWILPWVPVHKIDKPRESVLFCRHYQMVLHCLRERESTQAQVPQSPDKDYAEDRKPKELVPPSGTESNCSLCPWHLLLLSSPLPLPPIYLSSPFFPWKSAHDHRLIQWPSLKVWKGCGEKTGL